MGEESTGASITPMEAIRQRDENDVEFWSARALAKALDYVRWDKFLVVIERAKLICDVANQDVSVHFSETYQNVETGKGARRDIVEYYLSRYAVHLTLSCADVTKPAVAQSLAYITLASLPLLTNPQIAVYARKIKSQEQIVISKEQRTMRQITRAFQHIPFVRHFRVSPYFIDLYFPSQRIAVECDEHGHQNYTQADEIERQQRIEAALGCQFVRFNPDDPTFEVGNVISQIMILLYEPHAKA